VANVYAVKSGNWSDVTVWNTGALPTTADDVWANTYTVTIDISPTVLSIRNGASSPIVSGGAFVPTNGQSITLTGGGIVATSQNILVSTLTSGQSFTITGNISGGSGGAFLCVSNQSTGTLNIVGNITAYTAGFATGTYITNTSSGIINITGTVRGSTGSGNTGNTAIGNNSSGTISITGQIIGGGSSSLGNSHGVVNSSVGTVSITGTVTGGTGAGGVGAINSSSGTINIVGNVVANLTIALSNNASGTIIHTGTAQSSTSSPAVGAGSNTQVTVLSGPFLCASNAVQACVAQRWKLNANTASTYLEVQTNNPSIKRNLYTADYVGGNPPISDVRDGTIFGPNDELEGTCIIPPTSSVQFGVPVDDTVGTGNFGGDAETFWAVPLADLEAGSSGSVGKLVNKIPTPELIGEYLAAFDRV